MNGFIYYILNGVIAVAGLAILYVASHFWLGSQEGWQKAIDTGYWEFFFSRLLFTFLSGLPFIIFSAMLSWFYWQSRQHRNVKLKRLIFMEVLATFVIAVIFVTIALT